MRPVVTFDVLARPATFATKGEAPWREAVAGALAAAMAEQSVLPRSRGTRFEIHFEFRTPIPLTMNDAWDLDNLIKPTMDALGGILGYRPWKGPKQVADDNVDRIEAGKRTIDGGEHPGAFIEVFALEARTGLPGTVLRPADLMALGFIPLELERRPIRLGTPDGCCDWDTLGDVPASAGLYAFTVAEDDQLAVGYVGMTGHLWMVTKGRLPGGGARGGQRYGRPTHAGVTRKRINGHVTEQMDLGRVVQHWVKPMPELADDRVGLRRAEEDLLRRWNLRGTGWNRG